jgi:hypothetical protein
MKKIATVALAVTSALSMGVQAQQDNQALLDELNKQKKQIEELKQQVEVAVAAIEDQQGSSAHSNTTIGGYGELHYNNIETKEDIDFHRFVLFIGHKYSEKLRFFSELEVEHSLVGEGKPGEVELEQAYIEYDVTDNTSLKGGLFLVPVGIINETHEPDTFYGVERNPIESNIVPATWWEAGAGVTHRFGEAWQVDFVAHSGLDVDPANFSIRSGRQKVAKANADSMAYTSRIKWTGVPGLELAATLQYQEDITQGVANIDAMLYEAHAAYRSGAFGLRALWAQWDIDSPLADAMGADVQNGYYIEPSYRVNESFGVFARYAAWDNTAGNTNTSDTEKRQLNVGFNYWLHPNVVIKFDTENRTGAHNGTGFNLGIGYQF